MQTINDTQNTVDTRNSQSLWLLILFWTWAQTGPLLCTLIIYCVIKNANELAALEYHLENRNIIYPLFYGYFGLSILGLLCIIILRSVDLETRKAIHASSLMKWRTRLSVISPFILFLSNGAALGAYVLLLIDDITGNGDQVEGFWSGWMLAMCIMLFITMMIMVGSILAAVSNDDQVKQCQEKMTQDTEHTIIPFNEHHWYPQPVQPVFQTSNLTAWPSQHFVIPSLATMNHVSPSKSNLLYEGNSSMIEQYPDSYPFITLSPTTNGSQSVNQTQPSQTWSPQTLVPVHIQEYARPISPAVSVPYDDITNIDREL